MTKKELQFVEFVKQECKRYNIKCKLKPVKYLRLSGNIKCSGYFDEEEPALAVATNRQDWLEILVHEYCHLTQWLDNGSIWKKGTTSLAYVFEWLAGADVKRVNKHIDAARDLELDNEKRSVAMIKKWDLNIDTDSYIKKANAYVQFYNYMKQTRKWCVPNNSPYKNARVVDAMSTKFNLNYKKLSKRLEKVFIQENI
jgi:hypothetical protein